MWECQFNGSVTCHNIIQNIDRKNKNNDKKIDMELDKDISHN